MRILLIAPHPFYQERGTPIAVDMLCRVLTEYGIHIDLATFHEGSDKNYPNLNINRIKSNRWLKSIGPGFSIKKLICDYYLFKCVRKLVNQNDYNLIHAVEEGAFIALYFHWRRDLPFVYDMDSSMSAQLIEKMPWLTPFRKLFVFLEARPIKKAIHVMPMCQQLVDDAKAIGAQNITLLKDVSLVDPQAENREHCLDLRKSYNIDCPLLMYIGNLEHYQGIDLLLSSLALVLEQNVDLKLAIIGGSDKHISFYRQQCESLSMSENVIFTGPMALEFLGQLMSQADCLVSPRIKGGNTPMKIYTYMDSNRPILATNLDTHTQVLSDKTAFLCDPTEENMARGITDLLTNRAKSEEVAAQAKRQVREEHSYEHYRHTLINAYNQIKSQLNIEP
ncbi:glycosyltransferase family 4 protein [Pseudomonadota bacterium]